MPDTPGEQPQTDERELEYAKEFWGIANAAAGFAVVQTLVFVVAVGPHSGDLATAIRNNAALSYAGVAVATMVYLVTLLFCHRVHRKLLEGHKRSQTLATAFCIWDVVRIATVLIMGLAAAVLVYGDGLRDEIVLPG